MFSKKQKSTYFQGSKLTTTKAAFAPQFLLNSAYMWQKKYLLPGLSDQKNYQTSIKSSPTPKPMDLKYTNLNSCDVCMPWKCQVFINEITTEN